MTTRRQTPKRRDDSEQSRLFIKTARELGADEEQSQADALLDVLHRTAPETHDRLKRKRRSTRKGERRQSRPAS